MNVMFNEEDFPMAKKFSIKAVDGCSNEQHKSKLEENYMESVEHQHYTPLSQQLHGRIQALGQ